MIHLYQEEIVHLEKRNAKLQKEVKFLKRQLELKTYGSLETLLSDMLGGNETN